MFFNSLVQKSDMAEDKYPRIFLSQMETTVFFKYLSQYENWGTSSILAGEYSVTWHAETSRVRTKIFDGLFIVV